MYSGYQCASDVLGLVLRAKGIGSKAKAVVVVQEGWQISYGMKAPVIRDSYASPAGLPIIIVFCQSLYPRRHAPLLQIMFTELR